MKSKECVSWAIYWAGIGFILFCLFQAFTVGAQADPCQFEIDSAKSVCRTLGRKSPECATAIDDVKMCRLENTGMDPLEGLQTCETVCHTNSSGRTVCITTCRDRTGRRI